MLFAAKVWHFWIAVPLVALSVLLVIVVVAFYLRNVVAPRYPSRGQQEETGPRP